MGSRHSHHTTTIYRPDPAAVKRAQREGLEKQIEMLKARVTDVDAEHKKELARLTDIRSQIEAEQALLVHFPRDYDRTTSVLVFVGNTGDGKSTVCNRICGDESDMAEDGPFETSDQMASCTQELSKHTLQVGERKLTVVDAPGWNDSEGKDREHANNLCAYLYGCGGLNNFVLVRNSANFRFDGNFKLMLERYHAMFGDAFWKHLIVVLTRVDRGLAERQFVRGGMEEAMKQEIYDKFQLDAERYPIPVIPIGLDKYEEAIQSVVDAVSTERFECEQIKSPLQDLEAKEAEISQVEQEKKQKLDGVKQQLQDKEAQLASL